MRSGIAVEMAVEMAGNGEWESRKAAVIGRINRTARTVRQHRYPGLEPRSDHTGRSPGDMMPRPSNATHGGATRDTLDAAQGVFS